RRQIHRERFVPLVGRKAFNRRLMPDDGVVDEDVDRSGIANHLLDVRRLAQVGADDAAVDDAVVDDDAAGLGELPRNGLTEALCRSCDERDPAGQRTHLTRLFSPSASASSVMRRPVFVMRDRKTSFSRSSWTGMTCV